MSLSSVHIHLYTRVYIYNQEKMGIIIECVFDDCRHQWQYNGKSKGKVLCPKCYRNFIASELQTPVNEQQSNGVEQRVTEEDGGTTTEAITTRANDVIETPNPSKLKVEFEEDNSYQSPVNNTETFNCTECGNPVEVFQDCNKCGATLVWSE